MAKRRNTDASATLRVRSSAPPQSAICNLKSEIIPAVALLWLTASAFAVPPEGRRLDEEAFRKGLQTRGLSELLEPYLKQFPPDDPTEGAILAHDLKMREFRDPARSDAVRRVALREAQRLLELLIERNAADIRRFDWMVALARSQLYDAGEPIALRMLYRGSTPADRAELLPIMQRATQTLTRLAETLSAENARLDQLSIREFERLERGGHVEKIEALLPQADYMLAWARYYAALAREPGSAERADDLHRVLEYLTQRSELLDTPHETTHFQAQALLLAGLTQRALGDAATALASLNDCIGVIARLADEGERRELSWAVILANLERVRALTDRNEFDRALTAIQEFRAQAAALAPAASEPHAGMTLELSIALLDGGARQAQADQARKSGDQAAARRFAAQSRSALLALARQGGQYRQEIYALLYPLARDASAATRGKLNLAALQPLDQCALVAGLMSEAEAATGSDTASQAARTTGKTAAFERVVDVAEQVLASGTPLDDDLAPDVIYNLAVAQYRLGRIAEAARRFFEAGRDYPKFDRGESAATLAVQLASELYHRPAPATAAASAPASASVGQLYLDALNNLVTRFPKSSSAKYWKYFLAEALQAQRRYSLAAARFGEIEPDHENYLEARFHQAQCRAAELGEALQPNAPRLEPTQITRRADEVLKLLDEFGAQAKRPSAEAPTGGRDTVQGLLPLAELLKAETQILPGVDRAAGALQTLDGFEQRYGEATPLAGRVLRVRLTAFQRLGRPDDAAGILPAYVRSDPAGAGATLQSLYEQTVADFDRGAERDPNEARARAAIALLLARQVSEWAAHASPPDERNRYAFAVQLAEALLRAGEIDDARRHFAACLDADAKRQSDGQTHDARVLYGHAETAYRAKDYESALPEFNRAFRSAPTGQPLWWQALLRDLQCRTALKADPNDVLKVIRHQRFLHPDLGGDKLSREFDALIKENNERLRR